MSLFHSQITNKFKGEKREDLFHNCFTVENKKAVKHCYKSLYGLVKVPRAGLEPALVFVYQLDFKSNASTNSATEAIFIRALLGKASNIR